METGVVIIQEPVSMKTIIEEAPTEVILEKSSMEVDKINQSTVQGEADVPEVVNGSENKEIEESKREKDGESQHHVETKTESLKENAEPVKAIEKSDDVEQLSCEMSVDKEKEVGISQKTEEVHESPKVIETPKIQAEETESKASKSIEEEEHVLVRDIAQGETLVVPEAEAETLDNSTVLKTLETKVKERDTEEEETETVKKTNIISTDEVQESIAVIEPPKIQAEEIELKISKDTKEDTEPIMDLKEDKEQEEPEKFDEIPSDLALNDVREEMKDVKEKVDQVDETQTMEEKRGLDLKDSKAEEIDRNRTDETEEILVEKVVAHVDVEPVEQIHKQYIESPSPVPEEEVTKHQQGQEEDSFGLETKDETVSVPKSSEHGENVLEDKSVIDLQENETKLQKEEIEKHEPANEEVSKDQHCLLEEKSVDIRKEVPSGSHSEEQEGETVVEAEQIEEGIKPNVEEQVADKIQKSHEANQVKEEKDSRTAEASVNETEVEYKATVSAEEISKNIANETASEDDHKGENAKSLEVTKHLEEVKESPKVIETPTLQEDSIESYDPKDTEEHEHLLVRDISQIETLVTEPEAVETSIVQEASILNTLETTNNETKTYKETKEDTEPSMDLKVDKEKDISCDEVKPSDQTEEIGENTELRSLKIKDESHGKEESVEVKSKETVQEENYEEKQHESVIDVPSRASEKLKDNELEIVSVAERDIPDRFEDNPSNLVLEVDKEELKDDKKYEDKVDETQNVEEKRGLDLNEQEAEQIDRNRTKETEETRTIIDAKIKEETQEEEVALHHEGQEKSSDELEIREETLLVPESCPPKEMKLEKELIEKHELDNDQQIPLVEKSDEVIKVSSASASEEREGGIVLDTEKIEVIKANEEQKVAESHSSLPSTVSEKIEEEKVNEESPIVQTREVETSLTDKCSLDQIQEEEQANDEKENVNPETEKGEDETTTVRDMSQGEAVDTLTVHDSAIFKTLETTIHEPEAVDSPIGGEEQKSQVTKDDNKPSLELKEDKEPEETETSKTVILSDEVRSSEVQAEEVPEDDHQGENTEPLEITKNFDDAEKISSEVTGDRQKEEDVQVKESPKVIETPPTLQEENIESNVPKDTETLATEPEALDTSIVQEAPILKTLETTNNETEKMHQLRRMIILKMQKPSLESSLEVSEETSKIVDEKIEEEVTLHQEIQEEKTISVAESIELTKENAEKHESTGEEGTKAHQTHVEVKGDEAIQVSSAPPSEELESKTVVEAEKIERSLETAETIESPKEQVRSSEVEVEEFGEHCSSETNDESHGRKESVKVKSEEIVQADKDDNLLDVLNGESAENIEKPSIESSLEVSEETSKTIDEKPVEEVTLHQESEEEKTISVAESSELGEKFKEEESPSPIEQENETKLQKENVVEKHTSTNEEDTNAHQIHMEEKTDEAIQVSSASISEEQEGETIPETEKVKDKEEQVAEKIQRNLVEETKKEDENKTVGIDGSSTSKTTENVESLESLKLEESNKDKSQEVSEKAIETIEATGDHTLAVETSEEHHTPTFISDLEVKIPKQIDEIHEEETNQAQVVVDQSLPVKTLQEDLKQNEEETKESHNVESTSDKNLPVETSQARQTPSSETVSETISVAESSEFGEKAKEEESSFPIEQEKETKLQKENVVDEHTSTNEEDTNAHQIHMEEKTDEGIQVSSASISEEQEGETVPETEKVKDKEEQVAEKIQRNLVEETKKEDEHKTVGIDGSSTLKTTENVDTPEALKLEESSKDKSVEVSETAIKAIEATGDETSEEHHTLTFISELEDKIPKQIDEIHEETNEANQSLPVKTSQEDQTQNKETKESHNVESIGDQNLPLESSEAHQTPSSETVSETILPTESSEAAASMLASMEYNQVTVEESNFAGETQEKRHVSGETEENVGETVLPETEAERTEKSDDQIETSTKVTKVEDEDTKDANIEIAETTKEENMSHSPETTCLKQEDLKDSGTLMDDFTFPKGAGVEEHEDETSSTLPVVEILKELHTTLENERAIKDSAPSGEKTDDAEAESNKKDLHSIKAEGETLEKNLVTNSISREFEVNVGEKLQEEEETREIAQEKEEIPSSALPIEELEHVKQEGGTVQEDATASIAEKISPQEELIIDFETSKKEHETFKDEDQIFDIKEEKKNEEVQDEKLEDPSITRDDKEDASELRLGHEFASVPDSMLEKEKDINEVDTSETPIDAEKEVKEEHVHPQVISDKTKSSDERDFSAEESLDRQLQVPSSEVRKQGVLIQSHQSPIQEDKQEEPVNALITSEEHPKDFEQEKKRDIESVKTEPEDAIKHGFSMEEKNNESENIDQEETKEKSKQTETVTSIKEEEKETTQECFSRVKNTDNAIEKTKPAMQEIENLSSVSRTLDISKQKDEVPNQEEKEIADQVQKLENLKTGDEESEKTKNQVLEVKESEPARKSLSDLIQKVGTTNKTTEPHIEEEAKEEEEDEDGDEKASPDSLVMVEAKDTVIIAKTQQKKPHGILSGVGSKVKHSISKVKKAFTGKSSHTTTKPVSPK